MQENTLNWEIFCNITSQLEKKTPMEKRLVWVSLKVFCLFVVSRVSPLEGREAASSDETPPTHKEGEALEGAQGERGRAEVQRGLLVWQKRI